MVVHAEKLQLGDDLFKSTKGKKKSKETERILLKIFECMTEYMEIKSYELAKMLKFNDCGQVVESIDVEKLCCFKCDYKTPSNENMKTHVERTHAEDLDVEDQSCSKCDYETPSTDDMNTHMEDKHDTNTVSNNNGRNELEDIKRI